MPLIDCGINAAVGANAQRLCAHYILTSAVPNLDKVIRVQKVTQNDIDLFVGSMSVEDIVSIAMVPALKWTNGNNHTFCTFTRNAVNALMAPPRLWQRPLDLSRQLKIRNYFLSPGGRVTDSVIPGAIVLGELEQNVQFQHNTRVIEVANVGGSPVLEIQTEYTLRDNCPSCPWPGPANGDLYYDRCGNHTAAPFRCTDHDSSTLPFQIIDGQHRVLGLMKLEPDEQVPVVFMLRNKQVDPAVAGSQQVSGSNTTTQGKVFEKVNNSAEPLDKAHSLWIQRLLNPAAGLNAPERAAFDVLAELGRSPPWLAGNPWEDMIVMSPSSEMVGQAHMTSIDGVRIGSRPAAVTSIMPTLLAFGAAGYGDPKEQLTFFLAGARNTSPGGIVANTATMFGGAGRRPFRTKRRFETIVKAYHIIAPWAVYIGGGAAECLGVNAATGDSDGHENFVQAWNLHSASWTGATLANWAAFEAGEERSANELSMILHLMWDGAPAAGAAPGVTPPTGPSWSTRTPVANWGEYCNMAPDPIELLSPGTPRVGGVWNPASNDNGGTMNTVSGSVRFSIEWNGPRNTLRVADVQLRTRAAGGAWSNFQPLGDSGIWYNHISPPLPSGRAGAILNTLEMDLSALTLSPGDEIEIQIKDERRVGGTTEVILGYEIA
jgi:hypothetical protein